MQKKDILPGILNGLAMIAVTFVAAYVGGSIFAYVGPIIILVAEYLYLNHTKKQKSAVFYGISLAIWILFLGLITITSVQVTQ